MSDTLASLGTNYLSGVFHSPALLGDPRSGFDEYYGSLPLSCHPNMITPWRDWRVFVELEQIHIFSFGKGNHIGTANHC